MADFFKRMGAAFSAALGIVACSVEQPEMPEEAQPIILAIGSPDTRSLLGSDEKGRFGQWEAQDRMGTFVTSSSGTKYGYSVITPGSPATVAVYSGDAYKKFTGGEVVRAFYPARVSVSFSEAVMSIPVEQNQAADDFDFDAMPMVSAPYTVPTSGGSALGNNKYNVTGELIMANLASVAEFRIFSSNSNYAGETVTKVTFNANSSIGGSFTKDITATDPYDPSTLAISGYSETSVSTYVARAPSLKSSLDNSYSVYMVVAPGTYGGSIKVTTDKAEYCFPLKSDQTFSRSVIRSFGIDLGTCTDRTPVSYAGMITVTKTIQQILAAMGKSSVSNQTVVNPLEFDDVVSISTNGTGDNAKVYDASKSSANWRLYTNNGGDVVFTAAPGYELRSITITHNTTSSSASAYTFGGPASGVAQPVSGSSVTFKMMSGNMKITGFSVSYVPVSANPRVITGGAKSVTSTTAILSASFADIDASTQPQGKGFYWGISASSLTNELYEDETLVTASSGSYETVLYALQPSTTYYYQAFMTVWNGSSYDTITGEVMSFTTAEPTAAANVYLNCFEMPAITVTESRTGIEPIGGSTWYGYDLSTTTQKLVTHTYPYGGKIYRNYTSCVDQNKRCPLWVAYPMHPEAYPNLDSGRGQWSYAGYDPAIPASWQSSGSTDDYNNGEGYARGHMCASEDRQTCDNANYQTFYYTNQAPQIQNSFNGGIWSELESAVRTKTNTLSSRDTLYVVSGTLYEDGNMHASNDGGLVARPSHFYKLLMLCSFNSAGVITSAQGAAYLYENKHHENKKYYNTEYKTTINAIEIRAGFDFFVNIPSDMQESAESAFTSFLNTE